MITADMREYPYFLYSDKNSYGQRVLIKDDNGDPVVQGTVKLAIYTTTQSIQDNINYKNASAIALTHDKAINDTYIIKDGETLYKVLYSSQRGRYHQVFLATYE